MTDGGLWRPGEAWPAARLSEKEWAAFYRAGFRWRERGGLRVLVDGPGALSQDALGRHLAEDPPAGRWSWRVFDTLLSTMPVAHALYQESGRPVAVLADEQTAGRGRGDHAWHATSGGGLNLSLAWKPTREQLAGPLTLALGVAVAGAARGLTGHPIGLKWPNDGMADGRKCFGILVEAVRGAAPRMVVGIGVNVNGDPPGAAGRATSLEAVSGEPWSRLVLAVRMASAVALMLERWAKTGPAPLLDEWRRLSVTLGRRISIVEGTRHRDGEALDVAEDGSLRVRLDGGLETTVHAGEVSLRLDTR